MGKIGFWILVLAACCVDLSHQVGGPSEKKVCVKENNPQWPRTLEFPDGNGQPQLSYVHGSECFIPVIASDVSFKLYTRAGPRSGKLLSMANANILVSSGFNRKHPTILVTHGYLSGEDKDAVQDIVTNYLTHHTVNVIGVDWSGIAGSKNYFTVKQKTQFVGVMVAEFLQFLQERGRVDLRTVHLVGHSLGAHVMGIAGKVIRSRSLAVGRITGLDPAGVSFSIDRPAERLDSTDANFVDVIHTDTECFGFREPIGTVDFYPNSGFQQPGCGIIKFWRSSCSHSRAWMFFAESIATNQFKAYRCRTLEEASSGMCDLRSTPVVMGHMVSTSTSGIFFLITDGNTPFALGAYPWLNVPEGSWEGSKTSGSYCSSM